MTSPRIETRFDGAVAYVTLNRPPVNVIDFAMIDEIKAFLAAVRAEPRLCAVVLQGAGRVFSAGVDIPSHLPATVHRMIREVHSVFELLDDVSVPTIGLVRGQCLGGACELVVYLDYVIATGNARFGLPEIKLGVFPPAAAAFFPQRFGYQGAMQMLLTGESIEPEAAARIGLVSEVVAEEAANDALEAALAPLRQRSAIALRMVKRASIRARGRTFRDLVAPSEAVYLEQLMATRDAIEGLESFMEKRDPVWTHS
jgi:cyclohexa-1,5-dienecarbonyl-CoA hydratase